MATTHITELYDHQRARVARDKAFETGLDLGRDLGRKEVANQVRTALAAQYATPAEQVAAVLRVLDGIA
jgi:hypothetical protein